MAITLRAPEPDDLDFMYRLETLPDVAHISWGDAPVSRQLLWEYITNYSADIYRDRQLMLIIVADDGARVGGIEISDFDPANGHAMLGVAIMPQHRGKGYARQAVEQACEYCLGLGMHQLAVLVPRTNEASVALFSACGFKSSGCLRSWLRRNHSYEDCLVLQRLF